MPSVCVLEKIASGSASGMQSVNISFFCLCSFWSFIPFSAETEAFGRISASFHDACNIVEQVRENDCAVKLEPVSVRSEAHDVKVLDWVVDWLWGPHFVFTNNTAFSIRTSLSPKLNK